MSLKTYRELKRVFDRQIASGMYNPNADRDKVIQDAIDFVRRYKKED